MTTRTWAAPIACAALLAACGADDDERSSAPASARPIATSVCSPITYGGEGRPRFIVPLVAPLQGEISDHGVQNTQAVKFVLEEREWRAGGDGVAVQVCDEASAEAFVDVEKCGRNADAFARNPSVPAIVGPTLSSCAVAMLPILNRASDEAPALVSPGNTYLGLTREGPGVADGHPEELYPTAQRTYLRLAPADDAQAAALALVAQRAGARSVFALHDGDDYGKGLAEAFSQAAQSLGMRSEGVGAWDGKADGYRDVARRVRRSGAEAVILGGYITSNGARLLSDLRRELGPGVQIVAPDGFNQPANLVEGAGERAEGLVISIASGPIRSLPPAGRRWAEAFERRTGSRPCCYAVHTAQAMELVLDAIAASGGDRAGVLEKLRSVRVSEGLLGDFSFDRFGDTTLNGIALYRIEGGRLRYTESVEVPRDLLSRE
jgi:branched-chain amino acid transport system substrate-binding protein